MSEELEPFKRTSKEPREQPEQIPEYGQERYVAIAALGSPRMRQRIATAMWAERMERGGAMAHAGDKAKIEKAVNEILDNTMIYLEDS